MHQLLSIWVYWKWPFNAYTQIYIYIPVYICLIILSAHIYLIHTVILINVRNNFYYQIWYVIDRWHVFEIWKFLLYFQICSEGCSRAGLCPQKPYPPGLWSRQVTQGSCSKNQKMLPPLLPQPITPPHNTPPPQPRIPEVLKNKGLITVNVVVRKS